MLLKKEIIENNEILKERQKVMAKELHDRKEEIKTLEKKLKDNIRFDENRFKELFEAREETKRLNNIINELEKYIEEKAKENDDNTIISKSYKFALYDIVGKLQELKDSDK